MNGKLASFAKRDVNDRDFFFYPFNMKVSDSAFLTIDATPVCILKNSDGNGHKTFVFYTDTDREATLDIKGSLDGNKILVLTREEALNGKKVSINGREYFVTSDGNFVENADGEIELYALVKEGEYVSPVFRAYPELLSVPKNFDVSEPAPYEGAILGSDCLTVYTMKDKLSCEGKVTVDENLNIKVSSLKDTADEYFMNISYEGNKAVLVKDGDIIADNFYTGQLWEIGLKRFLGGDSFEAKMEITPLYESDKIYLQSAPKMEDGKACRLGYINLIAQYRIKMY